MIDQDKARELLKSRLGRNLVIVDEFESETAWCFGLGFINENDEIVPLMGDSIIRISKETGEME